MGFFKKIFNVIKDAVVDVVTAPFKIIKEGIDFVGHLAKGDVKAAFKDLTQMIGPALTIVSTVGTAGLGGIALNVGKQIAINAGGGILATVLGEAGVKGPVAGALVSAAQSFAGGGFKIDVADAAETLGKAALNGAAQTDGTLGDIAKVANVAVGAADGGFKNMDARDIADLAVDVAGTGALGKDVAQVASVADAALDGIYAARADGRITERDVLDMGKDLAESGLLGSDAAAIAKATAALNASLKGAKAKDGTISFEDGMQAILGVAGTGALGKDATMVATAAQGVRTALTDIRDGDDPLAAVLQLGQSGALGAEAQRATAIVAALTDTVGDVRDGGKLLDEVSALTASGILGSDAQTASLLVATLTEALSADRKTQDAEASAVRKEQEAALLNNIVTMANQGRLGGDIKQVIALLSAVGSQFANDNRTPGYGGITVAA